MLVLLSLMVLVLATRCVPSFDPGSQAYACESAEDCIEGRACELSSDLGRKVCTWPPDDKQSSTTDDAQ